MFVCVCVCAYIYIYIYIYTYIHAHTDTYVCVRHCCDRKYIFAYTHKEMHKYTQTHTHTRFCVHTHTCCYFRNDHITREENKREQQVVHLTLVIVMWQHTYIRIRTKACINAHTERHTRFCTHTHTCCYFRNDMRKYTQTHTHTRFCTHTYLLLF